MKTVIIQAKTKQLLQTLKHLKGVVKGMSGRAKATTCEITVTEGKATFSIPGAIFSTECNTQGTAKATIPFLYFFDIIRTHQKAEIEITIRDSSMSVGVVTTSVQTTFFDNDHILRTIQLPINYTDADLLKLTVDGYTWEELSFNKLTQKISDAEDNFLSNISKAYKLLEQYGVKYIELKELASTKLYGEKTK